MNFVFRNSVLDDLSTKQAISPEGETAYAYDEKTGNLTGITAPGGQNLTYTHDGSLPLTETLTGEVTGKVARKYDDDLRVTEQTVNGQNPTTYTYDRDGLLTGAGALQITRDPERGLITGTELSETTDARNHNPFGELESYEAATGDSTHLSTTYERDSLGRITGKTEIVAGEEITYAYRYDKAGRLIEVKKDGRTTATYTYDKNGTKYRIVSDHLGSPLLVVNTQSGEIAQRMTYDAFGRVTKDTSRGPQLLAWT